MEAMRELYRFGGRDTLIRDMAGRLSRRTGLDIILFNLILFPIIIILFYYPLRYLILLFLERRLGRDGIGSSIDVGLVLYSVVSYLNCSIFPSHGVFYLLLRTSGGLHHVGTQALREFGIGIRKVLTIWVHWGSPSILLLLMLLPLRLEESIEYLS